MSKPFTFAKSDDDNIPKDASNSDYWDERKKETYDVFGNPIMPNEDNSYPEADEVDDDSVIDRNFISNRDLNDEHYPDNDLV